MISTGKHLMCKNLQDYMKTLPRSVLDNLYKHPATCLAVFRELPELSKLYVMRLLSTLQPIPQSIVGSWINQEFAKEHINCIQCITDLHIWDDSTSQGWLLNKNFKENLKVSFLGGGRQWNVTACVTPDPHARDVQFLNKYAMERWECVLHYMVGSTQQEGISADAVKVLLHSGLMKRDDDGSPVITEVGFQFLLMNTSAQVWYFILQYLDTVEQRGLDLNECLALLFQLGFSTLGKDYSTESLSEGLQTFLQHLREFGLVYQRKRSSGRFYPTKLAVNVVSGNQNLDTDFSRDGYIIVETNFRVYAYTNSDLQVALLGLICELMYRFPNLTVGVITRESIRQALKSGITATQIINYLRSHSHPVLVQKNTNLPPTVCDQIKLWELERNRFTFSEGVLYNQFLSQADYELLKNYAVDVGVLICCNDTKRTMVVTKEGHDEVKKFWKRQSKA